MGRRGARVRACGSRMAVLGGFSAVRAACRLWRRAACAASGLRGRCPGRGYAVGVAQVSRSARGERGRPCTPPPASAGKRPGWGRGAADLPCAPWGPGAQCPQRVVTCSSWTGSRYSCSADGTCPARSGSGPASGRSGPLKLLSSSLSPGWSLRSPSPRRQPPVSPLQLPFAGDSGARAGLPSGGAAPIRGTAQRGAWVLWGLFSFGDLPVTSVGKDLGVGGQATGN